MQPYFVLSDQRLEGEQYDENASWIDSGCGIVNGRSVVAPLLTGEGAIRFP